LIYYCETRTTWSMASYIQELAETRFLATVDRNVGTDRTNNLIL
jgi:hypothetical protein